MLEAKNIAVSIRGKAILRDVSFTLAEHDLLAVVGPNGSGKTTLVRALLGAIPHGGEALLEGLLIEDLPPAERARRIGVHAQQNPSPFAYAAREVVALGRYAHRAGLLGGLSARDEDSIERAMHTTRTWDLRDRSIATLSGGELQRVFLARVLAQEPDILILDEPANHLDPEYQLALLETVSAFARRPGHAVLAILHDLNLARAFSTRALLLHDGRVEALGAPDAVLSDENLQKVYHVDLGGWMRASLRMWGGFSAD